MATIANQQKTQADRDAETARKAKEALTAFGITDGSLKDQQDQINQLKAAGQDVTRAQGALSSLSSITPMQPKSDEVIDVNSTEFRAKALLQGREQDLSNLGEELGLGKVRTGMQQRMDLLEKQAQDAADLKAEVKRQEVLDQRTLANAQDQAGRAIAGVVSSVGTQNREGVISSTNPKISTEFAQRTNERIDSLKIQLDSAKARRDAAVRNMEAAQKAQKEDAVRAYANDLARAQLQVDQIDASIKKETNEADRIALDIQKQNADLRQGAFDFFEAMPAGGLEGVPPEQVSQFFGVDLPTASILIGLDKRRAMIDPNDPEYIKKVAEADQAIKEAKWAGMTSDQKNFEYYKDLLKNNPERAQEFANQIGINDQKNVIDYTNNYTKTLENRQKIYDQTGVLLPVNSKHPVQVANNELFINVPRGVPIARGECGEFVNDVLNGGPGLFGNTFQSKKQLANSDVPISGGAFIEDTGDPTGHVGMVTRVYADGSFDYTEANREAAHVVTDGTIMAGTDRWNNIMSKGGFYDPALPGGTTKADNQLNSTISTAVRGLKFGSVEAQKTAMNEIDRLVQNGDMEGAKEFLKTTVFSNASAAQQDALSGKEDTVAALNRIQDKLDEYAAAGGNTGVFTGLSEKGFNKLAGRTKDPALAELTTAISLAIIDYRKAVSGAAFTESEAKEYDRLFPSAGKVPELNKAKIDAIREKIQADADGFYRRRIGETKYDQIFSQTDNTADVDEVVKMLSQASDLDQESQTQLDQLWSETN